MVCPNSLKSALIPWWAGIAERVGYQGEARFGLLTQRLPNPSKTQRPPMVAFYSALSGEPGIAQDRPQLHVNRADTDQMLATRGLRRGGIARSRAANGLLLHGRLLASPLSREETRLAVIEVLG